MHFVPILLIKVLLCLQFLCLCNGAPPIKDDQPPSWHSYRYTDQENAFILNELQNLPNDYIEASDNVLWKELARKIDQLWRAHTEGFPQERTAKALRLHFTSTLRENEQFMAALPETLRQQLSDLETGKHRGGKRP